MSLLSQFQKIIKAGDKISVALVGAICDHKGHKFPCLYTQGKVGEIIEVSGIYKEISGKMRVDKSAFIKFAPPAVGDTVIIGIEKLRVESIEDFSADPCIVFNLSER